MQRVQQRVTGALIITHFLIRAYQQTHGTRGNLYVPDACEQGFLSDQWSITYVLCDLRDEVAR